MEPKKLNIDCLNILNNILQLLEDRKYLYLGTNYEKIKKDLAACWTNRPHIWLFIEVYFIGLPPDENKCMN